MSALMQGVRRLQWMVLAGVVAGLFGSNAIVGTADAQIQVVLGTNNDSGSEFAATNGQAVFDTRTMNVGLFPRLFTAQQRLVVDVDGFTVTNGLLVILDAFEDGGNGFVTIEGRVTRGGVSTGLYAGATDVSSRNGGVLYIAPSLLATGVNTVDLRAIHFTGGSSYLKWDQVTVESVESPKFAGIALGVDDGRSNEFASSNFVKSFNAVTMPASQFPQKLDDTTWSKQEIWFYIDPQTVKCGRGLKLVLDAASMKDSPFQCLVDFASNHGVYEATNDAETKIHRNVRCTVTIPHESVVPGDAMIQLFHRADDQNRLFWDKITITNDDRWTLNVRLGFNDNSESEFLVNPIDPVSRYFDADTMPASMLPKELNTSWWQTQEITLVVTTNVLPRLTLDPYWESPYMVPMQVRVETVSAFGTMYCGTFGVSHLQPATVTLNRAIPPNFITEWPMTVRLSAVKTGSWNQVVTWDRILIESP